MVLLSLIYNTALNIAAQEMNIDIMKRLLLEPRTSASIQCVFKKNNFKMEFQISFANQIFDCYLNTAPLHIAVEKENIEMVNILLSAKDIDVNVTKV